MDTPETAPNRGNSESFNFELKNPEKEDMKRQFMKKSKSLKLDDSDYAFSIHDDNLENENELCEPLTWVMTSLKGISSIS